MNDGTRMALAMLAALGLLQAPASRSAPPGSDALLARIRAGYLRPADFDARELRYPALDDPESALRAARAEADRAPADIDVRWRLCRWLEALDHAAAEEEWGVLLGLVRAERRRRPDDARLQAREIEALLGVRLVEQAVASALQLARAQPRSAEAHLLAGDAQFARAEAAWRIVLGQVDEGKAPGDDAPLKEMLTSLDAARASYDRAVDLAPAEPGPRGARISLAESRRRMIAFLPPGTVPPVKERPRTWATTELRDLLERRPGDAAIALHAARLLASVSMGSARDGDLTEFAKAISAAVGERHDALAEETRGYLAMASGDWSVAADRMAAAAAAAPAVASIREWEAYCRWRTAPLRPGEADRPRAAAAPGAHTQTLRALTILEDQPLAAIDLLRAAVESEPNHLASRYLLGVLLLRRNPDSQEGRRHVTRVFEADAADPEAAFAYLVVQLMDGDREAARDALRELEQEDSVDADLRRRIRGTLGLPD